MIDSVQTNIGINSKLDEIERNINNELKKIQDEKLLSDGIIQDKFNQFESKYYSLKQEIISNK